MDNASEIRSGSSAELLVGSRLLHMGYVVAMPLMQTPRYDLIVDVGGRLLKVQVKWAQRIAARQRAHGKGDRAHYMVSLIRVKRRGSKTRVAYTTQDFDVLAVVCQWELIYFVPVGQLVREGDRLCRQVRIKDPEDVSARLDARAAVARWEPFRNVLRLDEGVSASD
ncbi:MAG TPA: group I intron-associated PD-(D/E)XK endonuclease [Polyangia bacterium]|nr:group I intron-associated PD-(D/E)XK endonuclease [Polyangia bacterium]